jgi:hypothetical protein
VKWGKMRREKVVVQTVIDWRCGQSRFVGTADCQNPDSQDSEISLILIFQIKVILESCESRFRQSAVLSNFCPKRFWHYKLMLRTDSVKIA